MRKLSTIAAILTASLTVHGAIAADGVMPLPPAGLFPVPLTAMPLPTPAPYGSAQNATMPQRNEQPYWAQSSNQQMPYWMQNQQPNNGNFSNNTQGNAQTGGQLQGGVSFNGQTQGQGNGQTQQTRGNFNQGYGNGSTPGYFPGYSAPTPTQNTTRTQPTNNGYVQTAPNTGYRPTQYQAAPVWNGPWNGGWGNVPWGPQGTAPWGNQWGNNYNQGFAPNNQWGNGPTVGR